MALSLFCANFALKYKNYEILRIMSKNISLEVNKAASFLAAGAVEALEPRVKAAQKALEEIISLCRAVLFPWHRQSHPNIWQT